MASPSCTELWALSSRRQRLASVQTQHRALSSVKCASEEVGSSLPEQQVGKWEIEIAKEGDPQIPPFFFAKLRMQSILTL